MRSLFALAALSLAVAAPAAATEKTYLVSITDLGLGEGEYLRGFSLKSWGVRYKAVCHIPPGWTIKAGGSATPEGWLEGEGSHGATWLRRDDAGALAGLVLVTLDAGPNWTAVRDAGGEVIVPATVSGKLEIFNDADDHSRIVTVGRANIRFVPARSCPAPR